MTTIKLSNASVEAAQPAEKDRILWDKNLSGFGCAIRPSGRKVYFVYYRNAFGQQRRPMIGRHGRLSCDDARAIARKWLSDVDQGLDPAEEKRQKRKAILLHELLDRYVTEYAKQHKKASTVKEDERLIKNKILPGLGSSPVESVSRHDIQSLHQKYRTTPYEANRVLSLLSKIFNLAEAWGLRPDGSNPCRHIKKFAEAKRSRFYSETELARIGAALHDASSRSSEDEGSLNCIRLLALTGCRLSEIVGLKWEWVNLEQNRISLPDSKTGARIIMIGAATEALLRAIGPSNGHVLRKASSGEPITANMVEHCWRRVRKTAELENGRLHDFRHTVGTYSSRGGNNAFIVRDLLGHKTLAMTGRYVEHDAGPLRTAANEVSNLIATALGRGDKELPKNADATAVDA